jgi:hypothetical protein
MATEEEEETEGNFKHSFNIKCAFQYIRSMKHIIDIMK